MQNPCKPAECAKPVQNEKLGRKLCKRCAKIPASISNSLLLGERRARVAFTANLVWLALAGCDMPLSKNP